MTDLPPFPVDEQTLTLIEEAFTGAYEVDSDGTHRWTGSEFSFGKLLDFLSGYDPTKSVQALNEYDQLIPDVYEYPDPIYDAYDVIRALIGEVRDLRVQVAAVLTLCDEWDDGVSPECSAMAEKVRSALGQKRDE